MAEQAPKKLIKGTVVSDKMDKTVVVAVSRAYRHPRFEKVIKTVKKYKVHDEHEQAKVGDIVHIFEGRPLSKTKYMYLRAIVSE
jgi:small subunit ribosomal protein S17